MTGDQVYCQEMQIFTNCKFEWMYIDSVNISSRWCLLSMMMLVDEAIELPHMKNTMEPHIEVVVEGIESHK